MLGCSGQILPELINIEIERTWLGSNELGLIWFFGLVRFVTPLAATWHERIDDILVDDMLDYHRAIEPLGFA